MFNSGYSPLTDSTNGVPNQRREATIILPDTTATPAKLRKAANRMEKAEKKAKQRERALRKARKQVRRETEAHRRVALKALVRVAADPTKGYAAVEAARTLLERS